MREKSLYKNYIFNLIRTFSGIFFPVATFTYAARILGETGIGQVNFTRSVVSCFAMLAVLGMNSYGTREAARLRDDHVSLSNFVQEMLIINGISTTITYVLLLLMVITLPKFQGYESLLLVNSVSIFLQGLGMEWLYQALEEYQYITLRSVAFQAISFIFLVLFVRKSNDVLPYAVISVFSSSGSYICNFVNARKYIDFKKQGTYSLRKHLKPLFRLLAVTVSVELYTVLDSVMLGFIQGDEAVGRYTAAVKINKMVISLITAVGGVLIPRISYYLGKGQTEQTFKLKDKAYNYTFLLSIPAAAGLFILSDEIIRLFSGSGFASAALTMRLLVPIVIVIPFSVATNDLTFVPLKKEKLIFMSTLTGAFTNCICNLLLIPRYAENGAAVATVLAETMVAVVCFYNVKHYLDMRVIFSRCYQYVIATIPILVIGGFMKQISMQYVPKIVLTIGVSVPAYFIGIAMFKNPYLIQVVRILARDKKHIS